MKIKLVGKPKDAPYLTPGKVYEVLGHWPYGATPTGATILDEDGDEIAIILPASPYPCPHARPAKWEVVE